MSVELGLKIWGIDDRVGIAHAFANALRPFAGNERGLAATFTIWRDGSKDEDRVADDVSIRQYFGTIGREESAEMTIHFPTNDVTVPVSLYVRGPDANRSNENEDGGMTLGEMRDFDGDQLLPDGRPLDFSVLRDVCAAFFREASPEAACLYREGEPMMPASAYLVYRRDPRRYHEDLRRIVELFGNQHTEDRLYVEWLELCAKGVGAPEDFLDLQKAVARELGGKASAWLEPIDACKSMKGVEVLPSKQGLLLAGSPFFKHLASGFFTAMLGERVSR